MWSCQCFWKKSKIVQLVCRKVVTSWGANLCEKLVPCLYFIRVQPHKDTTFLTKAKNLISQHCIDIFWHPYFILQVQFWSRYFIHFSDAGKSTIGGQIMYLTGMVDKRTLEKYEREAKEKNRETWYLSWCMDTNLEGKIKVFWPQY